MMADDKKFNLADYLKNVPKLDTSDGREQIEYIDIDLIDDDPTNFYEMSAIDDLVENIGLVGLQQPLLVRPNPDNPERVIIVSGHRRRAAIRKLIDEGHEDLRKIKCIRESGDDSPAMRELKLIYANSGTRRLSSAELTVQAERTELLLYQLKEEGLVFPGRMRDHVAEACKVSKSKLARLKVIRENLVPELKKFWEKGEMNESVAYACAQHPAALQRQLIDYSKQFNYCTKPNLWYESTVNERIKTLKEHYSLVCRRQAGAGTCDNAKRLELLASANYQWNDNCKKGKCCHGCDRIGSCRFACSRLDKEIKAAKAARKKELSEIRLAREGKDRPVVLEIGDLWNRFGLARSLADKSVQAW